MEDEAIRAALKRMDTTSSRALHEAATPLRELGERAVPYFRNFVPLAKTYQCRAALLHLATRYARTNRVAFEMGLEGCDDRSSLVRYRACGLLAYSLRKEALPRLQALLDHPDAKTREDAAAAIQAIRKKSHHRYINRDGKGFVRWVVNDSDDILLFRAARRIMEWRERSRGRS